ncbi:hypothetical protein GGS24DRAFT_511316 [Hypoxylon argillaceum]|nr:hypothetical protein GGS24DRAFT_511316 [Hypoxylon argillaceum]
MDCVEKLFEDLMEPVESLTASDTEVDDLCNTLNAFIHSPASQDSDYPYLLEHIKEALASESLDYGYFLHQMAYLGAQKPVQRKYKGNKARKLKSYRWIAQGMKNETYPLPRGPNAPPLTPSTTRLAALASSNNCAACGKTDANMRCPDCNFQSESFIVNKTTYCNKKCLQDHYDAHKPICEGRKMVYRAAILLHSIFIAIQEATYIYPLQRIYEENGILYLVEDSWDRAAMTGRRIFRPFPRNLAQDRAICRAALLWHQSQEVHLSMSMLIDHLFTPMCKSMQEAMVYTKNAIRPVCRLAKGHARNTGIFAHGALKLTLRSDEEYVVDLAAALLGWNEILAPWRPWADLRVTDMDLEPLATMRKSNPPRISRSILELQQFQIRQTIVISIITELEPAIKALFDYDSSNNLLNTSLDVYQRAEGDLMSMVREKIRAIIRHDANHHKHRLWMAERRSIDVQMALDKVKILKNVWMTKQEYDELKNSGADMSKIWAERIDGKLPNNEEGVIDQLD